MPTVVRKSSEKNYDAYFPSNIPFFVPVPVNEILFLSLCPLTFIVHGSHICDKARIDHPHIPQSKRDVNVSIPN
jgi:hypothetical protein